MTRNRLLALLLCLNVVLLAAVVFSAAPLPAAHAQATGLAGNYLVVSGEVQNEFDAVYLLDVRARTLHAFYYDRGTRRLQYGGNRDLERDFRHNRD